MSAEQRVFAAVAEPSRRKVLEMLVARGEMSASQICEEFEVTPQDISRHLRVLRESELVRVEKRAQQRIYRINQDTMMKLEGWAHQMARRLDALDQVVEREKKRNRDDVKN
jgi:DNA-binding transcriptional ArsR family regulator